MLHMNVGPGTFMTVRRFIYSAITTNLITRAPTTTAAIAYRISENIRKQNQQQRIYKQLAWSSKMLVILENYLTEQNKRTTKIMGFKPSWLKDELSLNNSKKLVTRLVITFVTSSFAATIL